jgi:succinyl-diaminopimelate desuccinylase
MDYEEYIDEHKDELVEFFRELLRFPSEQTRPLTGKPFGEAVDACYRYFLARAEADGFDVFDADGLGGHIEWKAEEPLRGEAVTFATALHLDVVPAGDGWTFPPYEAHMENGTVYGRGSCDNKDAVAAIYMAVQALRETGFRPKKNIRLIIGLDEETGWTGMDPYLERAGRPDFGFVPDARFPVINGEMGIIEFTLTKKISEDPGANTSGLITLSGGTAANVVPDFAKAVIRRNDGSSVELVARGSAAHASQPWLGLNAISVLMDTLGNYDSLNPDTLAFVNFYNSHIGTNLGGDNLGIGFEDAQSGHLIFNAGVLNFVNDEIRLTVNLRYPVTLKEEDIYRALEPICEAEGIGVERELNLAPIYYAPDTPLVQNLLAVYRSYMPDDDFPPTVIGGGTYARALPNAVGFGPKIPGRLSFEHQINEHKDVNDLVLLTKIYAAAIAALTETEEAPNDGH